MVREGLRPREYLRQFDKHNELLIARSDFYRGMSSAGFVLTPLEMDTVMEVYELAFHQLTSATRCDAPLCDFVKYRVCRFCAPTRRRHIDYDRFCRTVGEALAQEGLERAPLLQPVPHAPPPPTNNFLNFEERSIVSKALDKLSKHHDQVSNIFEIFKVSLFLFFNKRAENESLSGAKCEAGGAGGGPAAVRQRAAGGGAARAEPARRAGAAVGARAAAALQVLRLQARLRGRGRHSHIRTYMQTLKQSDMTVFHCTGGLPRAVHRAGAGARHHARAALLATATLSLPYVMSIVHVIKLLNQCKYVFYL